MLEGSGSAERLRDLKGAFQDVSRRHERANKFGHLYIFALVTIGTFGLGLALTMSPLWPYLTFPF